MTSPSSSTEGVVGKDVEEVEAEDQSKIEKTKTEEALRKKITKPGNKHFIVLRGTFKIYSRNSE